MPDQTPTSGAIWAAVAATCVVVLAVVVLVYRASRKDRKP